MAHRSNQPQPRHVLLTSQRHYQSVHLYKGAKSVEAQRTLQSCLADEPEGPSEQSTAAEARLADKPKALSERSPLPKQVLPKSVEAQRSLRPLGVG